MENGVSHGGIALALVAQGFIQGSVFQQPDVTAGTRNNINSFMHRVASRPH